MGSLFSWTIEKETMALFLLFLTLIMSQLNHGELIANASFGATSSCTIEWVIQASCGIVVPAVSEALQAWVDVNSCGTSPRGEECNEISADFGQLYSLRGIEIVFDGGFVSNFQFKMINHGNFCTVRGRGYTTKAEVTDEDFNYCTLQWLMNASTMTTLYGFSQRTDVSKCMELQEAYCQENMQGITRME